MAEEKNSNKDTKDSKSNSSRAPKHMKKDNNNSFKSVNINNEPNKNVLDSSDGSNDGDKTEVFKPVFSYNDPDKIFKMNRIRQKQEQRNREIEESNAKTKRRKIIAITASAILSVYILGVIFFSVLTFPNTYVSDMNLSLQTESDVKTLLSQESDDYSLSITGLDFNYILKGSSIDYKFDANVITSKIEQSKNPLIWFYEIFMVHDFKDNFVVSFDQAKVQEIMTGQIDLHNEKAIAPVNANLECDPVNQKVKIKQEVIGNTINTEQALIAVNSSIGTAKKSLVLGSDQQILPTIVSTDKRIDSALSQANKSIKTNYSLIMGGTDVGKVTPALVAQWMVLTPDYAIELDSDLLSDWVYQFTCEVGTAGKTRTFTTPYGKTVSVSGGSYGWIVDQDALYEQTNKLVFEGNTQPAEVQCLQSAPTYNKGDSKDWGNRYIDVDLSTQHARMYDDSGACIWETDIVSGKPDGEHTTASGVWKINSKESPSILIASDGSYRTQVQYWMPFQGNSVGFHDATWQSAFGGNRYAEGYGSHGCVNISLSAASSLYGVCNVGDVVVVHS